MWSGLIIIKWNYREEKHIKDIPFHAAATIISSCRMHAFRWKTGGVCVIVRIANVYSMKFVSKELHTRNSAKLHKNFSPYNQLSFFCRTGSYTRLTLLLRTYQNLHVLLAPLRPMMIAMEKAMRMTLVDVCNKRQDNNSHVERSKRRSSIHIIIVVI